MLIKKFEKFDESKNKKFSESFRLDTLLNLMISKNCAKNHK